MLSRIIVHLLDADFDLHLVKVPSTWLMFCNGFAFEINRVLAGFDELVVIYDCLKSGPIYFISIVVKYQIKIFIA